MNLEGVEKLFNIIPQECGEAFEKYPFIRKYIGDSYEWDNRTTIENTIWLIGVMNKEIKFSNPIDSTYLVPSKEISCPGCGKKYGHHGTKVDINSEECSKCAKQFGYKNIELVEAKYFIEEVLGYKS